MAAPSPCYLPEGLVTFTKKYLTIRYLYRPPDGSKRKSPRLIQKKGVGITNRLKIQSAKEKNNLKHSNRHWNQTEIVWHKITRQLHYDLHRGRFHNNSPIRGRDINRKSTEKLNSKL